jgi:hypothetical protein
MLWDLGFVEAGSLGLFSLLRSRLCRSSRDLCLVRHMSYNVGQYTSFYIDWLKLVIMIK